MHISESGTAAYVSLHQHSSIGSPGDALCSVEQLVAQAAAFGMPAIGLTDHGRVAGWPELARCCKQHGVKPIFGCELYVADGQAEARRKGAGDKTAYHLCAWAENEQGLKNIAALNNHAHTDGFWYQPRTDWDHLARHSSGLLVSTACLSGEAAVKLKHEGEASAEAVIRRMAEVFGGRHVYLEMQPNNLADQGALNTFLLGQAASHGLHMIATNDTHYVSRDDWQRHDLLMAIAANTTIADTNRKRYAPEGFYLRSPAEMAAAFSANPECLRTTIELTERCNAELPASNVIENRPEDFVLLRAMVETGIQKRFAVVTPQIQERMERELRLIEEKGFAWYFLKVARVVQTARERGILIGPGRGSAVGSLAVYALGITDVDPLRHNLLFERFLNPGRSELPDIDVDVQADRRQEVVSTLAGDGSVLGLTTYASMGYRKAIAAVADAFEVPETAKNAVLKELPDEKDGDPDPQHTLFEWLGANAARDCTGGDWFVNAALLYGTPLHVSQHASGFVVVPIGCPWAPLQHCKDGAPVLQYDMDAAAATGFTKFDFLASNVLEVLGETNALLRSGHKQELRLGHIPPDDAKTFALLSTGHTTGLFQLESRPMQALLRQVQPASVDQLSDVIALYRPGPLKSGMVNQYVERRGDLAGLHPIVAEIVAGTRGILLYQEQLIELAHRLGGLSLARADDFRRAMAKKKADAMRDLLEEFVRGAATNGLTETQAHDLANKLQKYSGYAFNRSHSVAYAKLAVWTAFAMAHAPAEFMAARLNRVDDPDRFRDYMLAAKQAGLHLLPPDINAVASAWMPAANGLCYGLASVKGVGQMAGDAIIRLRGDRPFVSVADVAARTKPESRLVNRRVGVALVEAGSFDSLQSDRSLAMKQFDLARKAHRLAAGKGIDATVAGEINRLGLPLSIRAGGALPAAWSTHKPATDAMALENALGQESAVAGILLAKAQRTTRDGRPFWILDLWLQDGKVTAFWWQDAAAPFDPRLASLTVGQVLLLRAVPRMRDGELQLGVSALLDVV